MSQSQLISYAALRRVWKRRCFSLARLENTTWPNQMRAQPAGGTLRFPCFGLCATTTFTSREHLFTRRMRSPPLNFQRLVKNGADRASSFASQGNNGIMLETVLDIGNRTFEAEEMVSRDEAAVATTLMTLKRRSDEQINSVTKRDETWEARVSELRDYVDKNGHCRVPVNYPENPSLGVWVMNVRKRRGTSSYLTKERIAELNDLGFIWEAQAHLWEQQFQKLREIAEEKGHCFVPLREKSLHAWARTQRNGFQRLKEGKASHLSPRRIDLLNSIGFVWEIRDASWRAMMEKLEQFIEQNGHCHIPEKGSDTADLYRWASAQRSLYSQMRRGNRSTSLTKQRMEELDAAGFVWSNQEAGWLKRLHELRQYCAESGNESVPRSFPANPSLGEWVSRQRHQYSRHKLGKRSTLTSAQVQALEAIDLGYDVTLDSAEDRWEKRLLELKKFRRAHGHCLVPQRFDASPQLGIFVMNQRKQFKRLLQGKPSTLTHDRIKQLNDEGFVWDSRAHNWHQRFVELKKYCEEEGDCLVPTNYARNRALSRWVVHQRRQGNLLLQGKPSTLSTERKRALDDIGFVWSVQDACCWRDMMDLLQKFRDETGNILVPSSFSHNGRLGIWAATQRREYRRFQKGESSSLTTEKIKELDALGFVWTSKERKSWEQRLQELEQYRDNHGDCLVPWKYPQNPSLSLFVRRQRWQFKLRNEGKKTILTNERLDALNRLGFVWEDNRWERMLEKWRDYRDEESKSRTSKEFHPPSEMKNWIAHQRYQYHRMKAGRKSNMTPDKARLLEKEGFVWNSHEQWLDRLDELRRYQQLNGKWIVQKGLPGYSPRLQGWVATQRKSYQDMKYGRPSRLTEERAIELKSIGFDFGHDKGDEWNERMDDLLQYKAEHSNCLVPTKSSTPLAKWVRSVRTEYVRISEGKPSFLTPEQISRLRREGFVFDVDEMTWKQMFDALQRYKSQKGDCLVPLNYSPNPHLSKWVFQQRKLYRRSILPNEQVDALRGIGFVFDEKEATFKLMLNALRQYNAEHGDCFVPQLYAPNPELSAWVMLQRKQYRLKRLGKVSSLTDEWIDLLEAEGFVWDEIETTWENRYRELAEFASVHGHCNVPLWYPSNPELGHWVMAQHQQYNLIHKGSSSRLSAKQASLLEDIGFS